MGPKRTGHETRTETARRSGPAWAGQAMSDAGSRPGRQETAFSAAAPEGPDAASLPELGEVKAGEIVVVTGWLSGLLVLGVFISFMLHFGDVAVFLTTLKSADPMWLAAAAACQCGTYACAAGVWLRVLSRAKVRLPFAGLFRLAVVQLFANQAVPSGGLSGSAMVARGLVRRGVAVTLVTTALLVDWFSYYASYLTVTLLAFLKLVSSGDGGAVWLPLAAGFMVILIVLASGAFVLMRRRGRIIPKPALRWRPAARLAALLSGARADMLRDGSLLLEATVLQACIFLLDTLTLWIAARSMGLDIDPASAFVSFVLASVVATLSPVPLGLGTFEATCTGLLHVMGGSIEASLAATLILRGFTLWLPMLLGLWLIKNEMRRPAPGLPEGRGSDSTSS